MNLPACQGISSGRAGRGRDRSLVRPEDVLRVALEDLAPAEDAVHDAAERVEVGRRPDERGLAADLLGRDPADGARAGVHGDLGRAGPVEPRVVPVLAQPREAEVEDVRPRPASARGRGRA